MRRLLACALALAACRQSIELFPAGTCNGAGPALALAGAPQACAAATAAAAHRFALCSCRALTLTRLASDSFDSTGAAGPLASASLGSDGNITAGGPDDTMIGGGLYASGNVTINGQLETHGSWNVAGTTTAVSGSELQITGDAFCGSDVSGPIQIAGTLHVPAGATVGTGTVAQATTREAVTVAPPCGCAHGPPADLSATVVAAVARNGDGAIGLDPRAATPAAIDLPCGVYYVAQLAPAGDLVLRVHGRSELAVAGDVTLPGALDVQLDAGAALDLVVAGALTASGGHTVGSVAAPARTRLWIGGASVRLDGGTTLAALVTAPAATVQAGGALTVDGSLLAGELDGASPLVLHYDRAALAEGSECNATAAPPAL